MVEHAVQDDLHAAGMGVAGQGGKFIVIAEEAFDQAVIYRVIQVVRAGFEDRVQVDDRDAERFQVIQLLVDALQVAAEVIPAAGLLGTGGVGVAAAVAFGHFSPLFENNLIQGGVGAVGVVIARFQTCGVVARIAIAEAIREDLVNHGILHPLLGLESRVVNGDHVAVIRGSAKSLSPAAIFETVIFIIGSRCAIDGDEAII